MTVTYSTANLVFNGNGENGPAATDFGTAIAPKGWVNTGSMTTVAYSAGGSGDLNLEDGIAAQGGNAYFAGGPTTGLSTATQIIDLSAYASRIDAGRAALDFRAQMGGFSSQEDSAFFTLNYLAADGVTILGSMIVDGPLPAERDNVTELLPGFGSDPLPVGVRSVEMILTMTRSEGTYNDGYADNISLHVWGLTKGQILANNTRDYTNETVERASGISFLPGPNSTAIFSSAQFGTGLIARAALIEGSYDDDTLAITLTPNSAFSAAKFTFVDWTDGVDTLIFEGTDARENLTGSTMSDIIDMSGGNDVVSGQAGDDWIDGGGGRDRLTGDAGADSFVLTHKFNSRDTVTDFTLGQDHLIIQDGRFRSGLTAGPLSAAQFVDNASGGFTTTEQRFSYDNVSGELWFDNDGIGASASIQIATILGQVALTEADFLIV